MSDHHSGYIVILDEDVRADSAEYLLNAIRMIKGVISVEPVIADYGDVIARNRRDKVWSDVLRDLARNGPG